MAQYTLAQAAKACGKSKSTVLRSIRAGRLSAVRDELTGGWLIEPVELHRLYPARADAERGAADDTARNGHDAAETDELRARLADAHQTIEDLRRRLDVATEQLGEALSQVRALTDQRQAPPAPAKRSWWRWSPR
jgi:Helix-turn-helix domain